MYISFSALCTPTARSCVIYERRLSPVSHKKDDDFNFDGDKESITTIKLDEDSWMDGPRSAMQF